MVPVVLVMRNPIPAALIMRRFTVDGEIVVFSGVEVATPYCWVRAGNLNLEITNG